MSASACGYQYSRNDTCHGPIQTEMCHKFGTLRCGMMYRTNFLRWKLSDPLRVYVMI